MKQFFVIADALPDPSAPDLNWDSPCPAIGWSNMVTNAVSNDVYFPEHYGPLSIKCAFDGTETYQTRGGRFHVSDQSYLILNDGQKYASSIESELPVNSFCVFFQPGFPEHVLHDLLSPEDDLLDSPTGDVSERPISFFEKLYPHNRVVSPILFALHKNTQRGGVNSLWLAEQFYALLEALLHVHRDVCREIDRLPAVKRSTRIERYRRLQRAKEFIDSCYHSPLTIPEIASVACLSTHHFLRSFKQVFGMTPYRYITQRRLEEACRLLKKTDLPVSAICYDIGFESPGSFSWLFRRQTGMSPVQYRIDHQGLHA